MLLIDNISKNTFNRNKYYILFLLLVSMVSPKVLATPNEIELKTNEEVSQGIYNQLTYLTAYNTRNKEQGFSKKNWYIFVIGDTNFDKTLQDPQYFYDNLDFTELEGVPNSIKDISDVNKILLKYNERLAAAGKPVIYYGIANKKVAISVPYFTNTKPSETSMGAVSSFYNSLKGEEASNASLRIEEWIQTYLKEDKEHYISQIMNNVEGGAVVVLKYYYALSMSAKNGKAILKWYSIKDFELSDDIKSTLKVTRRDIDNQYKALTSQLNKDNRLIEAWYNHITGKEIPKTGTTEESACANLSSDEKATKIGVLKEAIISNELTTIRALVLNSCSDVIASLDYKEQIRGIRTLLSELFVTEEDEQAILKLIHGIKSQDFERFFSDLKDDENSLFNKLLSNIDNLSVNFSDGRNFTMLIEELLRIGNENSGEYLKKERPYLLNSLLKIDSYLGTRTIKDAVLRVLTFNLDGTETNFETYLTANNYQKFIELIGFFIRVEEDSKTEKFSGTSESKKDLIQIGNELGKFFASRNNPQIYKDLMDAFFKGPSLLETVFRNEKSKTVQLMVGLNMASAMFKNLPDNSEPIYTYLTADSNKRLHDVLFVIHNKSYKEHYDNYESSLRSFYDGILKLFNEHSKIAARIELVKWMVDNNTVFNDNEASFMFLIDKIDAKDERNEVYKFLTANGYEYLNKITTNNILLRTSAQEAFLGYYITRINEHGTVEDRFKLLELTVNKGTDWDFFWAHDKEDMISALFSNLSNNDAMYLRDRLAENGYKMFKDIWAILQKEAFTEGLDRDNKRLASFVTVFSKILTKTKEEMGVELEKYTPYLDAAQHYLTNSQETVSMGLITESYVPLTRSNYLNQTDGRNSYKLASRIHPEIEGTDIVSVKLAIEGKDIINTYYEPFEMVVIEFIEDTKINDEIKFSKGTIAAVPAFFIPWLDGSIDASQNTDVIWLGVDAAAFVGSIAILYGVPVIGVIEAVALTELVITTADASIIVFEDELKAEFGNELVNDIEMVNMIWGMLNLSVMAPKGIVKIITVSGKIYNSGVDAIKSIKGKIKEIRINKKILEASLPELIDEVGKYNPKMLGEKRAYFFEQERVRGEIMASSSSNLSKKFIKQYEFIRKAAIALFLDFVPGLDIMIAKWNKDLNLKFKISSGILTIEYKGSTFCTISKNGIVAQMAIEDVSSSNVSIVLADFVKIKYRDELQNLEEGFFDVLIKKDGKIVFRRRNAKTTPTAEPTTANADPYVRKTIEGILDGSSTLPSGERLIILKIEDETYKNLKYMVNGEDELKGIIMKISTTAGYTLDATYPYLVKHFEVKKPITFQRGMKVYNPDVNVSYENFFEGIKDAETGTPVDINNWHHYFKEVSVSKNSVLAERVPHKLIPVNESSLSESANFKILNGSARLGLDDKLMILKIVDEAENELKYIVNGEDELENVIRGIAKTTGYNIEDMDPFLVKHFSVKKPIIFQRGKNGYEFDADIEYKNLFEGITDAETGVPVDINNWHHYFEEVALPNNKILDNRIPAKQILISESSLSESANFKISNGSSRLGLDDKLMILKIVDEAENELKYIVNGEDELENVIRGIAKATGYNIEDMDPFLVKHFSVKKPIIFQRGKNGYEFDADIEYKNLFEGITDAETGVPVDINNWHHYFEEVALPNNKILDNRIPTEPISIKEPSNPKNVVSIADRIGGFKIVRKGKKIYVLTYKEKGRQKIFKQYFKTEDELYKAIGILSEASPETLMFIFFCEVKEELRFLEKLNKVNSLDIDTFVGVEIRVNGEFVKFEDIKESNVLDKYFTKGEIKEAPSQYALNPDDGKMRVVLKEQLAKEIRAFMADGSTINIEGYDDFLQSEGIFALCNAFIDNSNYLIRYNEFTLNELVSGIHFILTTDFHIPFLRGEKAIENPKAYRVLKDFLNTAIHKLPEINEPFLYKGLVDTEFSLAKKVEKLKIGESFTMPEYVLASKNEKVETEALLKLISNTKVLFIIQNPKGKELAKLYSFPSPDSKVDNYNKVLDPGQYKVIKRTSVSTINRGTLHTITIEQIN